MGHKTIVNLTLSESEKRRAREFRAEKRATMPPEHWLMKAMNKMFPYDDCPPCPHCKEPMKNKVEHRLNMCIKCQDVFGIGGH